MLKQRFITNFVFEEIDEYDICSAAANMLNNAFEASLGTDRLSIQVQHSYEKNFLSTSKGVR